MRTPEETTERVLTLQALVILAILFAATLFFGGFCMGRDYGRRETLNRAHGVSETAVFGEAR